MIALLETKAAGLWSRSQVRPNVIAGLIVGIVALPLAMAFAIASGARPEQGLYTAIVAATLTALFGGTRCRSGPTGAFIAVLSIITAQFGVAGLQMATLMAGFILVALGATRLGSVIKYIPRPVIAGFTAGIGVIIFVGQWKDFFGLTPAPAGLRFHQKLWSLFERFRLSTWPPPAWVWSGSPSLSPAREPKAGTGAARRARRHYPVAVDPRFKGVATIGRRSGAYRARFPCRHSRPSPWPKPFPSWDPRSPSRFSGPSNRCCLRWSRTAWPAPPMT